MIDARMEAARKTDQSGGRGWDFSPEDREPSRMGIALAILGVIFAVSALIAGAF